MFGQTDGKAGRCNWCASGGGTKDHGDEEKVITALDLRAEFREYSPK